MIDFFQDSIYFWRDIKSHALICPGKSPRLFFSDPMNGITDTQISPQKLHLITKNTDGPEKITFYVGE